MPSIVFRVCWMQLYDGLNGDECVGGGQYIEQHDFGGEIFNFRPYKGYMYGYVQPPGRGHFNDRKIRIERLGARKNDQSVDGILVAWAARNPNGGKTYVVGWYKDATVFRAYQNPPRGSNRECMKQSLGYYATAVEKNCLLLPVERRILPVPTGTGGIGQANIWYPDDEFEQRLMQCIEN